MTHFNNFFKMNLIFFNFHNKPKIRIVGESKPCSDTKWDVSHKGNHNEHLKTRNIDWHEKSIQRAINWYVKPKDLTSFILQEEPNSYEWTRGNQYPKQTLFLNKIQQKLTKLSNTHTRSFRLATTIIKIHIPKMNP